MRQFLVILSCVVLVTGCTVSYGFQGTNINYNVTKTMEIRDFTNQATLVYAPLVIQFNESIKDFYTRNTKLNFVDSGADLELEGEIVRYDLTPLAVGADAFAAQTRLTMAVKIRFRDNQNPSQDKEETVSAYRDFDSNRILNDVQEQLNEELTKEIVDQIFNTTLSNW